MSNYDDGRRGAGGGYSGKPLAQLTEEVCGGMKLKEGPESLAKAVREFGIATGSIVDRAKRHELTAAIQQARIDGLASAGLTCAEDGAVSATPMRTLPQPTVTVPQVIEPETVPAPSAPSARQAKAEAARQALADILSDDDTAETIDAIQTDVANLTASVQTVTDSTCNNGRRIDTVGYRIDEAKEDLKDVIAVATNADSQVAVLGGKIDDLVAILNDDAKVAVRKRLKIAHKASKNPILERLMEVYRPGDDDCPASTDGEKISIDGPAGFGKSYSADQLAEGYDVFIVHGCSPDAEEIGTLQGGPVADGESVGGFTTVDGKLAQAFRAAASGKNTLCFLDEHYRFSPKVIEWMLLTLQPRMREDGTRYWSMTTKQPDNGAFEVLEAPCTKLHFLAAGNLESRVPVAPYWDRWMHHRLDFTETVMSDVCMAIGSRYGIRTSGHADADLRPLTDAFAACVALSRDAVANGALQFSLTPRDFERACGASDGNMAGVAGHVARFAPDKLQSWDADTGDRLNDATDEDPVGPIAAIVEKMVAIQNSVDYN